MKVDLSGKTGRLARQTLSDFSEKMLMLLADMSLEEISVQKMCDICNYPRSTFYNYFDDIYDLMDYCWTAIYIFGIGGRKGKRGRSSRSRRKMTG